MKKLLLAATAVSLLAFAPALVAQTSTGGTSSSGAVRIGPDGKPISASETYQRGQMSSGSGDYRSPYPGLHGWYWHNTSKKDVKLVLNAAGFWTEAWMFSGDPMGDPMPLQDPAPPEN